MVTLLVFFLIILVISEVASYRKSKDNEVICKTTLRELQERYQLKLSTSSVFFVGFAVLTIWAYCTTDGIACFFAMFFLGIIDVIILVSLLSNLRKWSNYKDMTQKQYLDLQVKSKKENEEIARKEKETSERLRTYNAALKIGKFLGGL